MKTCKYCGCEITNQNKVYCSISCQAKGRRKGKEIKCIICNKTFYARRRALELGAKYCSVRCMSIGYTGRKLSEKICKKISKALKGKGYGKPNYKVRGKKNGNYKHGKSKLWRKSIKHFEYIQWRRKIFERDNYKCQHCGFHGSQGYITAHHIKSWFAYPDLRYNLDNGLTLCEPCHSKTDNYKGRARKKSGS